jgi:hypothetical protein
MSAKTAIKAAVGSQAEGAKRTVGEAAGQVMKEKVCTATPQKKC